AQPADAPAANKLPEHAPRLIELGSLDAATGYRQFVTLDSRGGSLRSIQLSDPRYTTITKPRVPLSVVGSDKVQPQSLELDIPEVGRQWRRLHWRLVELVPEQGPHTRAVFELEQAGLRVRKIYEVRPIDPSADRPEADAYALKFSIEVQNLETEARTVRYILEGPTGLALERIITQQRGSVKTRDVVAGFLTGPATVNHQLKTAADIAGGKTEEWQRPVQYVGLDSDYFSALLCPQGNPESQPPFDSIKQQLVERNSEEPA
ncbi:MAG: hypothetical protein ACKOJF_08385, partial [Planctomycetaceae bacterium]